ncbi:MAG: 4'-phosphopantetheinyl transferase superfamily protein [Pseudomonadota bacterium]
MSIIEQSLRALLPQNVSAAGGPIAQAQGPLFPGEEEAVARAVPVRQTEFRAGRTFARAALAHLGASQAAIPRAADRRPLWPTGVVGAITHSRHIAAAIAARSDHYLGLGVDLEPATPLDSALYRMIGRPQEQGGLAQPVHTGTGTVDRAKLVFAAKEAVFKAYYPLTRHFLDFQDATVGVDPDGRFTAVLVANVPPVPGHPVLHGRWMQVDRHILAVLTLAHGSEHFAQPYHRVGGRLSER